MSSWRKTKKLRKRIYEDALVDLVFELNLDPFWRQQLFDSPQGKRFVLTHVEIDRLSSELGERVRQFGLQFYLFNDGITPDGFVVFGFKSAEYPAICTYSTNNPAVI